MSDAGTLREPFADLARQRETQRFGMLVFLASEAMLFAGLFGTAMALRMVHPGDYVAGSRGLHLWFGTANTAVLLTSSAVAALAVEQARRGKGRRASALLVVAAGLGVLFLLIKFGEYAIEYREGVVPLLAPSALHASGQTLFMTLYFFATGLHALHVIAGIVIMGVVARWATASSDRTATAVGNAALYWHLVDVIWVFLFPTLYLAR